MLAGPTIQCILGFWNVGLSKISLDRYNLIHCCDACLLVNILLHLLPQVIYKITNWNISLNYYIKIISFSTFLEL